MAGLADEARVLGVGHRLDAEKEVVHVDAVDGTFVFFGVLRTHEEIAGGDQREFGGEIGRHRRAKRIAHRAFRLHCSP